MPSVSLLHLRRRRPNEFLSIMQVHDDDGGRATRLAGQRVTERFGRPSIWRGGLTDADLDPSYRSEHGGSAGYVAKQIDLGSSSRPFVIDRDGSFADYHGGSGWAGRDGRAYWFTAAALSRGISWSFLQTYYLDGQGIGRFRVIFRVETGAPYKITVRKIPA